MIILTCVAMQCLLHRGEKSEGLNTWRGTTRHFVSAAGLWVALSPRIVFSVSLYERILFKTIFVMHKGLRTPPPNVKARQCRLSLGIRFFLSASGGP